MSYQTHEEIVVIKATALGLKAEIEDLKLKVESNRIKEEDIDLIVAKVCEKIEERIYHDVGHGIMSLAWKGLIIAILLLAGYGSGIGKYFH